jgi:hypothetical protein
MAMPKGFRTEHGYATVKDGQDYRTISEKMSGEGFKMNHATARNVFLSAMSKIASDLIPHLADTDSDASADTLSRHPLFQGGIADIIQDLD